MNTGSLPFSTYDPTHYGKGAPIPMVDWMRGIKPRELVARLRARRANTSVQDIEDAVQDVLLNIQRKLQSDSPPPVPHHPDAFVIRSVINRLNSMYRSRKRIASEVSDEAIERHINERNLKELDQPDQLIEARERARLFGELARLIASASEPNQTATDDRVFFAIQCRLREELTDQQWILLKMRVLQGLGYQECARALNISLGGAHNWTQRALAIVRECLEDFGTQHGALDYDND